ncbi:Chloramphenicol acetyltransferase [Paenibacillus sp. OK003]|nr:Chloramphenicol acetyltransferase [Paenibacillus sp. OK003]
MIFNRIDVENWSRKPYFEHYINNLRCTYSMTANIEITRLLAELKNKGINACETKRTSKYLPHF